MRRFPKLWLIGRRELNLAAARETHALGRVPLVHWPETAFEETWIARAGDDFIVGQKRTSAHVSERTALQAVWIAAGWPVIVSLLS